MSRVYRSTGLTCQKPSYLYVSAACFVSVRRSVSEGCLLVGSEVASMIHDGLMFYVWEWRALMIRPLLG